ncbi:hypothetical protein JCM8547_008336 [Rhodosporidiobolus lusitaniae]
MGVFTSVRMDMLTRAASNLGLPEEMVRWIKLCMEGKEVRLRFEGEVSEAFKWESGILQGSPASPILFLIYNAALLRVCRSETSIGLGWINDVNVLAWGNMVKEHTTVTLFSSPRKKVPQRLPTLFDNGSPLMYSPSLTMLGVILDGRLTFAAHIATCAGKASSSHTALSVLSRSRVGLSAALTCRLVLFIVLPCLTWCAAV